MHIRNNTSSISFLLAKNSIGPRVKWGIAAEQNKQLKLWSRKRCALQPVRQLVAEVGKKRPRVCIIESLEPPWVLNSLSFRGCWSAFPVLRSLCIWPNPCVLYLLVFPLPPSLSPSPEKTMREVHGGDGEHGGGNKTGESSCTPCLIIGKRESTRVLKNTMAESFYVTFYFKTILYLEKNWALKEFLFILHP